MPGKREPMDLEIEYRDTEGFMQRAKLFPREALTLFQALADRLDEWTKEDETDAE